MKRKIALILIVLLFAAALALAAERPPRPAGQRPQGPPPEAFAACEGKQAGDAASFVSPFGDTITGTCESMNGRLVLRPDNPPPGPGRRPDGQGAPPDLRPETTNSTGPVAGTFPVVDTGQETCYNDLGFPIACPVDGDAFSGQDASFAGNPPSYTDNGDGTVTDNVTGLMWQQRFSAEKLTWDGARDYVDTMNARKYLGYNDWRLPTIKQLYSLIDFRGTDPAPDTPGSAGLVPFIDTRYFAFAYGDTSADERIIDSQWATTTLYAADANKMFGVNFADGRIKGYDRVSPDPMRPEKTFYVRLCRSAPEYGLNNFTDNRDGTVTDRATGLMWARADSGQGMDWESALAWVADRNADNYMGHNDWRLPNAKELQSIVDYARSPDTTASAAIDPVFETTAIVNIAGQPDYPFFWTGTTHIRMDGVGPSAVYVAFGRGLGEMRGRIIDVHGAGCQRTDPKTGDPADFPRSGYGPQGDVQRLLNFVRLVRNAGPDAELVVVGKKRAGLQQRPN